MTLDIEEYKREQKERKEKQQAEIAGLCTDLERILTDPCPDMRPLERQGDLLDCLLYAVMRHNLKKDKDDGQFNAGGLELVLRIQKQCIDTLKAAGTVEYMNSIASVSSGIYPPRTFSSPRHSPERDSGTPSPEK